MTIRSLFGSLGFVLAIGAVAGGSQVVNRAPSSSPSDLVTIYKVSEKNQIRVTESGDQVVLVEKFDPTSKAFVTAEHTPITGGWTVSTVNTKTKAKVVTQFLVKNDKVVSCRLDPAKKCAAGSFATYVLSGQTLGGRAISSYRQEYWQNQERAIALTYFKEVLVSGEMELLDAETLKLRHVTLAVKEVSPQSVTVKAEGKIWTLNKESTFSGTVLEKLAGARAEDVYLTHGNFYGHDFISHIRVAGTEHSQRVQTYIDEFPELSAWSGFFPASNFYEATPVGVFRDYKDLKTIHYLMSTTLTPVLYFADILFAQSKPFEITRDQAWRNLVFVNGGFSEFNLKHRISNSVNAYPSHFEAATQTAFWRTKDKATGKEPVLFKDQLNPEFPGVLKDRLNKLVFHCRQHEVAPDEALCRIENINGRVVYGYASFRVADDSGAPMQTVLPKQKEYEKAAADEKIRLSGLLEWEAQWSDNGSYTYNKSGRLYQPAHGVKQLSEFKGEYGEYDVDLYLEEVFAKGWELKSTSSASVVWFHDSDRVAPFLAVNYLITYNRKTRGYTTQQTYSKKTQAEIQNYVDQVNAYNQQVAEYNAQIAQQNQNGYITRGGRRVGYVENGKVYSVSGIFSTPNRLFGPVGTVDAAGNYSRRTIFGDMPTGYTLSNGSLNNGIFIGKP